MERETGHLSEDQDIVEGAVDYCNRPALRSSTGRWTSALFVIGVEIAERSAYTGIASNLISYMTGPLHESTAAAAAAVNTWSGAASFLPLVGGFIADSLLGRSRTVVVASVLYILGLGLLTLSSVQSAPHSPECGSDGACRPSTAQLSIFYSSLYLVAFAQGAHRPSILAFGADQFDQNDPEETKSKSSFFNWWYFSLCGGSTVTSIALNYIQDNVSWVLGFGIPCIFMVLALLGFLLGTTTYRYYVLEAATNPLAKVYHWLIEFFRPERRVRTEDEAKEPLLRHVQNTIISDGAQISIMANEEESSAQGNDSGSGSGGNIAEAKQLLQLSPVWVTCLMFAVVLAQTTTFFTKQGSTLDRTIAGGFQVPPAALQGILGITSAALVPVYDRLLEPAARKLTRRLRGITMLQRMGTGMVLSMTAMVVAALVEGKRLRTAADTPASAIHMSVWWLVPQYVLLGVANVFTMIGLEEFFYDQVPDAMRSLGLALYLSIFGIGDFLSGFIISTLDYATGRSGESWFSDDLNRAHLDYFYWLLAGLSAVEVVVYVHFARSYVYKKKANVNAA